MTTIIELIKDDDTLTLYPTPDVNGWVYDNVTLDAWYRLAQTAPKLNKRPNAHGSYNLGKVYANEHRPIIAGQYFGTGALDALVQRNRLNSFYNDGEPLVMRVTDEQGATTRIVWLLEADPKFRYDFAHFPFDVSLVAPDPRRYGVGQSDTDGMPSAGTGLFWGLGEAPSGLYFDWGTAGTLGQVEFTNTGEAASSPRIEVGGPGSFEVGFRITEIETGRELTLVRGTTYGDVIVFNSRTKSATISNGGGDITGSMTSRDWFTVPKGATRHYQINSLGNVTGAPTVTLYAAPAYL